MERPLKGEGSEMDNCLNRKETAPLESCLTSKESRAVRRGAVGKVPAKVTRWRPTLLPVRFGRGRLDSLATKGLAAYLIARLGSHAEPPEPWPSLGVWQEFATKSAVAALKSVMATFRRSRPWSFGDLSEIIESWRRCVRRCLAIANRLHFRRQRGDAGDHPRPHVD